jgi:secreted trypsin-like serine protease
LHITGWGKTESQTDSAVLQKTTVPYVSREICNAEISYGGMITETMFCAGFKEGGKDACHGDSGGPLVYLGDDGNFVQGGIVAWGKGCALENYYGVYTNLAHFYNWIMGYIGEN